MNISDPIADMLTRVRNASRARHTEVVVPASRTKREIARILKDEGFIADVSEEQDGPTAVLRLQLKYVDGKVPVVSRPEADQQARPARLRAQDRHPARARRPRHRHRQHQPGDHDRRAGPQGPARRRSPGVRLVGRTHVTNRTPAHRRPVGRRRDDRRAQLTVKGPKGTLSRELHPDMTRQPARTARSSSTRPTEQKTPQAAPRPDPDARQQHGRRRHRRLPQGPRDHRRRLSRRVSRQEADAQPGLQPPDRDRSARRASASRSRTPPASRSSASTRSSSARSPPRSARPASPSPTRARASATPARRSAARPARPARSAARSNHWH